MFSLVELGINIGAGTEREGADPTIAFKMGVEKLLRYCDYFVVHMKHITQDTEMHLAKLKSIVDVESANEVKKRATGLFDCETCLRIHPFYFYPSHCFIFLFSAIKKLGLEHI